MRAEKKTLVKEDGRYLVFYHFKGTANKDQTEAFECLSEPAAQVGSVSNIEETIEAEGIAGTPSNSTDGGAAHV